VVSRVARFSQSLGVADEAIVEHMAERAEDPGLDHQPRMRADRSPEYLRWRLANPDRVYRIVSWVEARPRAASSCRGRLLISHMCASRTMDRRMTRPSAGFSRLFERRLEILRGLGFLPLEQTSLASQRRRFLITSTEGPGRLPGEHSLATTTLNDWDFNLLETMGV